MLFQKKSVNLPFNSSQFVKARLSQQHSVLLLLHVQLRPRPAAIGVKSNYVAACTCHSLWIISQVLDFLGLPWTWLQISQNLLGCYKRPIQKKTIYSYKMNQSFIAFDSFDIHLQEANAQRSHNS